jgi:hypothetical protein
MHHHLRTLTPIGPYVLIVVFFAFFNALPEYLTILCMVKAGKPILAMLWNTALCTMTLLKSSMAGTCPGSNFPSDVANGSLASADLIDMTPGTPGRFMR